MRIPRNVTLWVAIAGLAALAAWVGSPTVILSGDPHRYYEYRHSDVLPAYPVKDVVEWLAAIAIEAIGALGFLAFARKTKPAVRLLAVGLLYGAIFLCLAPFAMHAPPYYDGHVGWLFFAACWCVVTAIAAAIEALVRGAVAKATRPLPLEDARE